MVCLAKVYLDMSTDVMLTMIQPCYDHASAFLNCPYSRVNLGSFKHYVPTNDVWIYLIIRNYLKYWIQKDLIEAMKDDVDMLWDTILFLGSWVIKSVWLSFVLQFLDMLQQ